MMRVYNIKMELTPDNLVIIKQRDELLRETSRVYLTVSEARQAIKAFKEQKSSETDDMLITFIYDSHLGILKIREHDEYIDETSEVYLDDDDVERLEEVLS